MAEQQGTIFRQQEISSAQNPRVKEWKKLDAAQGRRKAGQFRIESRKLVADAIASGFAMDSLVLREGSDIFPLMEMAIDRKREMDGATRSDAIREIQNFFEKTQIFVLSASIFDGLMQAETPDGIAAIAKLPSPSLPDLHIGRWLILDEMQDPGNVGAILRSAEAFGFFHILLRGGADPYGPKALRGAMGATFRLSLYHAAITKEDPVPGWLDDAPLPLIGADLGGTPLHDLSWPDHMGLVIGNEGNGLSIPLRERLDARVTIPMQGRGESLNAAVSASVLMAFAALEGEKSLR